MTNVGDLSDARVKFDRASEHLDALKAAAIHWLKPYTDTTPIHFGLDGDWHTVSSTPFGQVPDPRIAAIAGDFVNNLRSVLDYIVWQAVLREGEQPGGRHFFPIYQSRDKFDQEVKFRKSRRQESPLFGIPVDADAWTVIERAQPFKRTPGDPFVDHLAVLQRVSNTDKHRALPVQFMFPHQQSFLDAIGWSDEVSLAEQRITTHPVSLESPTELIRFRFSPPERDPGMHMKSKVGLNPTFGEIAAKPSPDGVTYGTQVTIFGATNGMVSVVQEVADGFAALPRVTGWW
jgi:hypothetical protein